MAINSTAAMINSTLFSDLPPLPSYTLTPAPPLFSWISDFYLSLIAPIATYWTVSMFFHFVDVMDLWPQYRIHTPAEILKRNHATRYEVAKAVLLQQVIQVTTGAVLGYLEPEEMVGKEAYDIAVWARRIRIAQRALPSLLGAFGLDALAISKNVSGNHPLLAGALAGGQYPWLTTVLDVTNDVPVPAFAGWELKLAEVIYGYMIPAAQYFLGVLIVDSWQYWLHRAMHESKWLYVTFHSHHHRLYVPYAYGALYNHPVEAFFLDTLGASIAFKVAKMTARQGAWFFCCCTIKTIDDHCGYSLPWDPLQKMTSNNAAYHDIHHQMWGIKSNYSQPFFTFWDKILGTNYKGGDTTAKYERSKKAAQLLVDAENTALKAE